MIATRAPLARPFACAHAAKPREAVEIGEGHVLPML
jgi:hypothetical protein